MYIFTHHESTMDCHTRANQGITTSVVGGWSKPIGYD